MTDYDAGSVSTGLRFDVDHLGAQEYDRLIQRAERHRAVETEAGLDVQHAGFDEYERKIRAIQGKDVEVQVKLDLKDLKAKEREHDQIVRQMERRRKEAAAGEVSSAATYLQNARAKHRMAQQELNDQEQLLKHVQANNREMRVSADVARAEARLNRERARAFRQVGDGADDGGRGLRRFTRETSFLGAAAKQLSDVHLPKMFGLLSYGTKIPIAKLVAIGTAISSIIPPAVALAGALGPVVGLLGAIPGLAITGIGALVAGSLGLRGVSDAIGSAWDTTTKSSIEAVKSSQQAEKAAEGVTRAQEDLNDAYFEAARRLEDMRLAEQRARQERERSTDSLSDARKELARLQAIGASQEEISDQRREVAAAELDVTDSKLQARRATEDLSKAEAGGLAKMDEVVSAQQALADATQSVADKMETGSASANKLQQDLNNLSPAGRDFVKLIRSEYFPLFTRLRNEAQEGLLPGVGAGLNAARRNFPVLERMVRGYSDALGDAAESQGRLLGDRGVGNDLDNVFGQGEKLIRSTARATMDWERGLIHVAVAAEPLLTWAGKMNEKLAAMFLHWAEQGRESGRLQAFFRRVGPTVETVVTAIWDLGKAFQNIGAVGARVWGNDLLRDIGKATAAFRKWTESVKGQRELEDYFVRWRRRWRDIADAVREVFDRYRQLRKEGEKPFDALTEALAEAFSRALPKIAENIARSIPNLVEAFIKGFTSADAWGKLIIGGWLISKFGGKAAWLAIGRTMGGWMGLGIAEGAAAGVSGAAAATGGGAAAGAGGGAAAGLLAKFRGLPKVMKAGMILTGIQIGSDLLEGINKRIGRGPEEWKKALRNQQEGDKVLGVTVAGETDIRDQNFITRGLNDLTGSDERIRRARHLEQALDRIANSAASISPKRAKELREEIEKLDGVSKPARREMDRLVDTAENRFKDGEKATKEWQTSITTMVRDSQGKFAGMRTNVQFNTKLIHKALKDESGAGREALANNMQGILDVIRRTMRRGGKVTDDGLALIKRLYVNELRFYGLSPREAVAGANIRNIGGEGSPVAPGTRRQDEVGKDPNQYGSPQRASGGWIGRPGERGRDRVHAVLGRGEAVLNFAQQRVVNAALRVAGVGGGLPQLFARTRHTKHYMAAGGIVGVPGTTISADKRIVPDLVSLKRAYGLAYSAGYAPTGHAAGGEHPLGLAADIVPDFARNGSWRRVTSLAHWAEPSQNNPRDPFRWVGYDGDADHGEGNHLHLSWQHGPGFPAAWVKTLGGVVRGNMSSNIRRVVIRGKDSPLKSMMQGVVDNARRGANRKIRRILSRDVSTGMGPHVDTSGATGGDANLMRRISAPRGWSFGDWWEVDRRETGHGHDLYNEGSGAALRGQFMPGLTQGEYGIGSDPSANPSMAQQIWSMAKYIKERYGNPSAALEHHNAYDWYGGGGFAGIPFVGGFDSGGIAGVAAGNQANIVSGGAPTTRHIDKSSNKVINRLESDIGRLGNRYDLNSRWQDLTEEDLIVEGTETTPPHLDQAAITQRLRELENLIKIRRQITMKYARMVRYLQNLMSVWRGVRAKFQRLLGHAQNQLKGLRGKKDKESNRTRKAVEARIDSYTGTISGANEKLDDYGPRLSEAAFNAESSAIDLQELRNEAAPLRDGGAGLELPDWEAPGATDDQQAIADQAVARANALQGSLDQIRRAFTAFASSGDIGQGGFSARDAVVNPSGVPGPGYVVGPNGQLIPVVGASGASAVGGSGGVQALSGGGNTFIFQSTVPYTRDQALEVGKMASAGIDGQAPTVPARKELLL